MSKSGDLRTARIVLTTLGDVAVAVMTARRMARDLGFGETDEFGIGASCSLREAIQAANTDAAFGGCSAGGGDDTITLPAGTYTLTLLGANDDLNQSGDLDIRTNITINGAGAASTR